MFVSSSIFNTILHIDLFIILEQKIILLTLALGYVAAAPQQSKGTGEPIAILSQSSNIEVDGSYQYR